MELQKPLDPRARFCIVMCVDFEDQRTEESSCFKEWVTMIAALFWVKIVSRDVLEDQQNREKLSLQTFYFIYGVFLLTESWSCYLQLIIAHNFAGTCPSITKMQAMGPA